MIDELRIFTHQGYTLRYCVLGKGAKVILAFHGAGGSPWQFQALLQALSDYTCYSFALIGHGSEMPPEKTRLETTVWKTLLTAFLEQHQITTFAVIAYSIGNRALTQTLHGFHEKIPYAVCIAPDNIAPSFWYQFATRTSIGERLFNYLTQPCGATLLKTLLNFSVRFYDQRSVQGWKKMLSKPHLLQQIKDTWLAYSTADFHLIAGKVFRKTKLIVVLGEKDKIVSVQHILPRLKNYPNCRVVVLPNAHHDNVLQQLIRLKEFSIFE